MKLIVSLLFCCTLLISGTVTAAQSLFSLHGEVINSENGVPVPGATVLLKGSDRGTAADSDGRFELRNLEAGSYTLIIRAVGFATKEVEVTVPLEGRLSIGLEPDVVRSDDVIVTASPLGRNIRYQSANAYDIQQLQDRQASSLGEMLDGEPGIAMRSFGPAPSRPVIRGFDGDRLLILENGERMGDLSNTAHDHNISIDPLVAERVEVVRGPASLLYGSSALGGVVNIITSDIPREWETGTSGTAALEGSSMNDMFSGFGRIQQGGENWAATGRFSYRGGGDVRTPEGRLPGTFIRNFEGGGGLGYRTESFNGGLSLTAIDHNYGLPEEISDPDEEAEIRMNQQTLQGQGVWSTTGFFDQVELRFHGSRLFQQEVESEFEPDGLIDEDIELEFEQYAINSTLTARHGKAGFLDEGVIGLNTQLRRMQVGGEEAFTPGINSRSASLFTYHESALSRITTLQFGLRGEMQSHSTRTNSDFPDLSESHTDGALSGSVGLNIRPAGGLEIGVQVARSHRFPILEELYADGVHFGAGVYERGDAGLVTEVGHGADLFLKWANSRYRAEISGFYYRISDYVAFEPTGEVFTDSREREWDIYEYRARNAELLGGEAQFSVLLTNRLQTGAAADLVRGSMVDDGSPLPTMPPVRYRIFTRYETGNWWIGGDLRIVNNQNRVVEEELPTDGYTLLGMNAGARFGSQDMHRISLSADNLTNALYRDHLSRVDRSEFGSPMPGRNVRLSYRVIF